MSAGSRPTTAETTTPLGGEMEVVEVESVQSSMMTPSAEKNTALQDAVDIEDRGGERVEAKMEDIALKALHTDDDSTLSPWTFRTYFLGLGLSAFGSALATIFMFKPQPVGVSVIFLTVISYVMGHGMALCLPSKGRVGRWLNPHPFNSKEHLAIIIFSSSASHAAHATEVLAAQKLYYNVVPNPAVAVLLLFSSQLLGYGLVGFLRKALVYPTKMLWPSVLPLSSLVETLHRDRDEMKKRWNFFWIIFAVVAVWELFPQYIMPVLTGISILCLSNRDSLMFTNIFGGTSGNEGLGLFSICFDWQYIGTAGFFLPLQTLFNGFIGYVLCACLFVGLYYRNVWDARNFPFLSQQLFSANSTETHFRIYNQSAILNSKLELDPGALEAQGLPSFATTYASTLLTTNLTVTATIVHILIFHSETLTQTFGSRWPTVASMRQRVSNMRLDMFNPRLLQRKRREKIEDPASITTATNLEERDPHYRMMLAYPEVPNWWYASVLLFSLIAALACNGYLQSTLPWWGLVLAVAISFVATLFLGALAGLLGFYITMTPVVQLLGGYIFPGRPVANMYFVLFGGTTQTQAMQLVAHLKLAQYGKLAPRATFTFQVLGTVFGALINYVIMSSITTSQREILLSIQGTNIWSGHAIQSFNSNAIAFGALSQYMFSIGRKYSWVVLALPLGLLLPLPLYFAHRLYPKIGFDYVVMPLIVAHLGYLSVGINSSVLVYFSIGFFVQFYVRKRYPRWFIKYNYLLAAAIGGGTELLVFVTTFAVQGASGKAVEFPAYWGNNYQSGNYDFCARNPALGH